MDFNVYDVSIPCKAIIESGFAFTITNMHKTGISTSINVHPKDVFLVLKDFKNYSQWNPWITIIGEPIQNARIKVSRRQLSLWKSLSHKIITIKAPEQIIWRSDNWLNLLVHTERAHIVHTKADGSSFCVTKFYFNGPLAKIANMLYIKKIHKGLKIEAAALKFYCEKHFKK